MVGVSFLEIDTADFEERLNRTLKNVGKMESSLLNIGQKINENILEWELIPYESGYLEESYEVRHIKSQSNFIELEFGYSGEGNPNIRPEFEDYALFQHEDASLGHPNGGQAFYLSEGVQMSESMVFETLKKDFLSCFEL